MERYDLIAVGGGTAGLVAAAGAAALGLRPALVERDALGGDCLWTGCVPSKAFIASAKLAHAMRHADRLGLIGAAPAHVFEHVMQRVRAARARVAEHDDPERFRKLGVEVVFGPARFETPRRIRVAGRTLESRRIVIATGAVPSIPSLDGLADAGFLTHTTAFDQDHLPQRIALLGGGPVGLEFAQVYARLGAQVTVVEMLPQLLPREDPEAATVIRDALRGEGVTVYTGAEAVAATRCADGAKAVTLRGSGTPDTIEVDEIFVSTGRRANTDELGLDEVGIRRERGAVVVDTQLRASVKGVWAAGDVTGGRQFTHMAEYQAKLVLRNAVFPLSGRAAYDSVPAVTYTDPEVARVGLTEPEARDRFGEIQVYRYDFRDLDRAIADDETGGFVKIVTRPNGRILGATVVASGAGNLIVPLVMAKQRKLKVGALSRLVYPYPTMAEGVKRAADSYYRERLAGRTGEWVRRVVRWFR